MTVSSLTANLNCQSFLMVLKAVLSAPKPLNDT